MRQVHPGLILTQQAPGKYLGTMDNWDVTHAR